MYEEVEKRRAAPDSVMIKAEPYDWPYDGDLDLARTALLCIDLQTDFNGPGGYVDLMGYDLNLTRRSLGPTRKMQDAARQAGMMVVHTREGHDPNWGNMPLNKYWRSKRIGAPLGEAGQHGRVLIVGEPGQDILPEVAPMPGEIVIDKPSKGAFTTTDIDLILRSKGITHLIICGTTTDVCVAGIMREANDLGYECVVIEDATGATKWENHVAALEMVKMQGGVFGCVSTSDNVVDGIRRAKEKRDRLMSQQP
ncbi:MAG: cysteine hydrolase family protein [Chloroflexota bacterium]